MCRGGVSVPRMSEYRGVVSVYGAASVSRRGECVAKRGVCR